MHAETRIEPDTAAVAPARRWARERLAEAGVGGPALDLLVLLVSEAVTNAVEHADPPVLLRVDVDAVRTRVEVSDGARAEPILRNPPPTAEGGRGVMFVDRLASRWGTLPHADDESKTVWFELVHDDAPTELAPSPHARTDD
ncbi:ATP-binding protein [Cellulomonas cellasea]|uniref:ATP-binding protein n=1 Tax=Cellulomonas cellasea TaxID=43670 RepID=UPI0025A4A358|nr:ATP-binding protein [Cellulomonas cellasea]MDM8085270.1 ATP-binding protein [Cellulomonas cellasea]